MTKEEELTEIANIFVRHAREYFKDDMSEPEILVKVEQYTHGVYPRCQVRFATAMAGLPKPAARSNYAHIIVRDKTPLNTRFVGEKPLIVAEKVVPALLAHAKIIGKTNVLFDYQEVFDIVVPGTVGLFDIAAYPATTTVPWYEKG